MCDLVVLLQKTPYIILTWETNSFLKYSVDESIWVHEQNKKTIQTFQKKYLHIITGPPWYISNNSLQ